LTAQPAPSSSASTTSPSATRAAPPGARGHLARPSVGRDERDHRGTGSGKTTLLNLIPRFFDASAGVVSVGGCDVRELALESLWARIGIVPQTAFLFRGSVASNLRVGKPDATEADNVARARSGTGRDFVAEMPGGLEASIDQGGTNVSGGQRQRLSIARAVVRRPDIYLFDDCFSALDASTDARLREALRARRPMPRC